MLGQCKSQSRSGFVGAGVGPVEGGKYVGKLHLVHTRSVVGNIDNPVFVVLSDVDQDGTAFRAVIDSVADNVVEGAVQVTLIGI